MQLHQAGRIAQWVARKLVRGRIRGLAIYEQAIKCAKPDRIDMSRLFSALEDKVSYAMPEVQAMVLDMGATDTLSHRSRYCVAS